MEIATRPLHSCHDLWNCHDRFDAKLRDSGPAVKVSKRFELDDKFPAPNSLTLNFSYATARRKSFDRDFSLWVMVINCHESFSIFHSQIGNLSLDAK